MKTNRKPYGLEIDKMHLIGQQRKRLGQLFGRVLRNSDRSAGHKTTSSCRLENA